MCLWGSAILNPDLGLFRVPSASDCSCFCRSQGGTLLQEPTPPRQTDHSSVLETDGLSEVPGWGLFPTCFNQMPTICKAKGQRLEMAAVLSKVWKKNHWEKRQVWRSPRTHWGGGAHARCVYLCWILCCHLKGSESNRNQSLHIACYRRMEKLIVVVGLMVHVFSKQIPCFCSLPSGVPVLYRLQQGEAGHSLFYFF